MLVSFDDKGKSTKSVALELEKREKIIEERPILQQQDEKQECQPQMVDTVKAVDTAKSQQAVETPKPKAKAGNFFTRLKKIKNYEIYLAIGLILIMVVIYLTTFGGTGSTSPSKKSAEESYAREIEASLVKTLSEIKGAGHVSAMVTVVGSATIEIAYNIDEKTVTQTSGGSSTTTTTVVKTPVIINGKDGAQPLIILEIKPKIKGIVVVASGANDVGVRLELLRAVQAVIADNNVRIEIFSGKE